MLNRVSEKDSRPRQRLTQDERRRQLLGIGLKMLTERPIQDVALDAVAEEAGISRGLLFHYFPSKTAYYEAVVAAAGRRILRNVTPPDDVTGRAALAAMVEAFVAQIERRHELYRALVEGSLADVGGAAGAPHRHRPRFACHRTRFDDAAPRRRPRLARVRRGSCRPGHTPRRARAVRRRRHRPSCAGGARRVERRGDHAVALLPPGRRRAPPRLRA